MKVAICIPHNHPNFEYYFMESLTSILLNIPKNIEVEVLFERHGFIDDMRERLAMRAIEGGATHLLWLDTDMYHPKHTLTAMVNTFEQNPTLEAVTGLTCRKNPPFLPHVYTSKVDGTDELKIAAGFPLYEPFKVVSAGYGCLMILAATYTRVDRPWFTIPIVDGKREYGEDIRFFNAVGEIEMLCNPVIQPVHFLQQGYSIHNYIRYNKIPINNGLVEPSDEQMESICQEYMKLTNTL